MTPRKLNLAATIELSEHDLISIIRSGLDAHGYTASDALDAVRLIVRQGGSHPDSSTISATVTLAPSAPTAKPDDPWQALCTSCAHPYHKHWFEKNTNGCNGGAVAGSCRCNGFAFHR